MTYHIALAHITLVPHCIGTPDGFSQNQQSSTKFTIVADASLPSAAAREIIKMICSSLKMVMPTFIPWNNSRQPSGIYSKFYGTWPVKPQVWCPFFHGHGRGRLHQKPRQATSRLQWQNSPGEDVSTRKPANFKIFLQNDDSKTQLFKLMFRVSSCPEAAKRLWEEKWYLLLRVSLSYIPLVNGQPVQQQEIHRLIEVNSRGSR